MTTDKKKAARSNRTRTQKPITLAVDIGGTGIKAEKLDARGKPISERAKIPTPSRATPKSVLRIIASLAEGLGEFDRVSVGFPGVVKDGVIYTAANLGSGWGNFPLESEIGKLLERPVRLANDADVQGLGCASGHGVELVITLGTGFGSVIFVRGIPIHLELGHHPFHKGKTYEQELGVRALKKKGKKKWNKMLAQALEDLARTFNFDRLYIGGGNAKEITLKLPPNVRIVSNEQGLLGGIRLWQNAERAVGRN